MMIAYYTTITILIAGVSVYLVWPWIEEGPEDLALRDQDNPLPKLRELYQEKEFLMTHLKDLELDWQMGKLTDVDHQNLKNDVLTKSLELEDELNEFEKHSWVLNRIQQDQQEKQHS